MTTGTSSWRTAASRAWRSPTRGNRRESSRKIPVSSCHLNIIIIISSSVTVSLTLCLGMMSGCSCSVADCAACTVAVHGSQHVSQLL